MLDSLVGVAATLGSSRSAEATPRWRGQIEHVGSEEKRYFRDAPGLLDAIGQWGPSFVASSFTLAEAEKEES